MHTGRWLTRDPIGYAGSINLYAYCGNNPATYADPSGRLWSWAAVGVGAGIGALAGALTGVVAQSVNAIEGHGFDAFGIWSDAAIGGAGGAGMGAVVGFLTGDPSALLVGGSLVTTGAVYSGGALGAGIAEGILSPNGPVLPLESYPPMPNPPGTPPIGANGGPEAFPNAGLNGSPGWGPLGFPDMGPIGAPASGPTDGPGGTSTGWPFMPSLPQDPYQLHPCPAGA